MKAAIVALIVILVGMAAKKGISGKPLLSYPGSADLTSTDFAPITTMSPHVEEVSQASKQEFAALLNDSQGDVGRFIELLKKFIERGERLKAATVEGIANSPIARSLINKQVLRNFFLNTESIGLNYEDSGAAYAALNRFGPDFNFLMALRGIQFPD